MKSPVIFTNFSQQQFQKKWKSHLITIASMEWESIPNIKIDQFQSEFSASVFDAFKEIHRKINIKYNNESYRTRNIKMMIILFLKCGCFNWIKRTVIKVAIYGCHVNVFSFSSRLLFCCLVVYYNKMRKTIIKQNRDGWMDGWGPKLKLKLFSFFLFDDNGHYHLELSTVFVFVFVFVVFVCNTLYKQKRWLPFSTFKTDLVGLVLGECENFSNLKVISSEWRFAISGTFVHQFSLHSIESIKLIITIIIYL